VARLPQNGDTNWGVILNEFLLVSHHENGSQRGATDVANVREFGAVADGSQSPEDLALAVQAAAATGKRVYFPAGRYVFTQWTFGEPYQHITCAPGAILTPASNQSWILFSGSFQTINNLRIQVPPTVPLATGSSSATFSWPDGLIQFAAPDQMVRNLDVEALAPIAVLVKISRAMGSQFEHIRILADSTIHGVYVERSIKTIFIGGEIKGNNSYSKTRDSVGLYLGMDQHASTAEEYGRSGVAELRAYGLTVHHWETGIRFAAQTQDDPTFMGCNFENNTMYGVRIDPATNQFNANGAGAVRNLNLFGCHLEGTCQSVYVARNAVVHSAMISGCVFGMRVSGDDQGQVPSGQILSQRVINAQGVLRGVVMTGCLTFGKAYKPDAFIWQVEASIRDCVDLFNYWSDMPGAAAEQPAGNFATGAYADRIFRIHSDYRSADGRTINVAAWLRHDGDRLGFFKAEPVPRPGGYGALPTEGATTAQVAQMLAKLVDDLASLGLIAKT
jgi:hypothetical protein